ncbi:MAG: hypothetical protein SGI72_02125 [Planctomycetota bacterium]|nr:hypothetical protein [Planctomycetota bacterium]
MHQSFRISAAALVATALIPSLSNAQVREDWRRSFDFGTAYSADTTAHGATHPAGGYVIAGSTLDSPTVFAQRNTLVVRFDAAGNVVWSRSFTGDPKGDGVGALGVAASGAIYAASSPGIFNQADTRLVKYDASGTQQWVAVYGIVGVDEVSSAREMFVDASENVTLGVSAAGAAISSYNMVVLSYSSAGVQNFATPIDGPLGQADQLRALCRDSAGDFIAAGSMDGSASGSSLLGLAKVSASGAIQWTRSHDFTGVTTTQLLNAVVTDSAGNIYACGGAGTAPSSFVGVLISYDSAGNFRWIQQLPGAGNTIATRIAIDPWQRITVTALQSGGGLVAQYDALGNPVWQQSWAQPGYSSSTPVDLVIEPSGDVTVLGQVGQSSAWLQDIVVTHHTPAGVQRWARTIDENAQTDYPHALLVAANGRVAVVGRTLTYTFGPGVVYGPSDSFTVELGDQSQPFCYGDGTGTACPCANTSTAGDQVGCLNSNAVGARIDDAGDASIANDTLTLTATDVPGPALFFQGTGKMSGGAGFVFGDGLLCLGGTITRLGIVFPTGTTSVYPGGLNPNPIHIGGMTASGDTRHYQAWYRDAVAFCSAATFNLTQGLSVTWAP